MTHYRSAYRQAVREAIEGMPELAAFTFLPAWTQKIDASQLPVFGVSTASEGSSRQGDNTVHRVTTVRVSMMTRAADDVESELDDLSLAVEAVVLAALDPISHIVELSRTSIAPEAGGEQKIGTLLMEFSVTRFTEAGHAT